MSTVDFLAPRTWDDALAAKAAHPDALPIAGGSREYLDWIDSEVT